MKKLLPFLFLSFLTAPLWGTVHVSLSKEKLSLNESFSVKFTLQNSSEAQPDFSPLEADFTILTQGQNHATTVVNGKFSSKMHWTVTLRPKRAGSLMLPAISFGTEASQPIGLEVSPQSASKQDNKLLLETTLVAPASVYEQAELVYIIRLYRAINLASGSLSKVVTSDPDALIEPLGDDREYEAMHSNGKRYIVLERRYAISPQRAGELIISPTVFEGEIVKGDGGFFNMQTEHRRLSSAEEKVQVLSIPADFQKHAWFPARAVTLTEEWSQDIDQMVVGEPITWTVNIKAEGCRACQIPDMSFELPSALKHYIDKTEMSNVAANEGFVGLRKFKVALIAKQAAEIILPEMTFKWWNLKTDRMEIAKIPSRKFTVQAQTLAMNEPHTDDVDRVHNLTTASHAPERAGDLPAWVYALLALNLLWGLKYLRALYPQRGYKKPIPPDSGKAIKKLLQQACEANDVKLAYTHLLAWCRSLCPDTKFLNLQDVKIHFPSLEAVIIDLNASLYGSQKLWQGLRLWQEVEALKVTETIKARDPSGYELKKLYPK